MKSMALFAYILCLLTIVAQAQALSDSRTYIVHMDLTLLPTPFSSHNHYYKSLLTSLTSSKYSEPIYTYTNAIHGFSARLSTQELNALQNSPGYLSCTEDIPLKLLTTHSTDFLGLNSVSGAWPASHYGKDVIIGVVDTGIWPDSKSFDDDGMTDIPARWKGGCYGGTDFNTSLCNRKLIGARFFNKGLRAAVPNISIADSARDYNGHGTHVSSTAAGNYIQAASYFGYGVGTSKGVAPRARLAMYTLGFTREEGTYSSDMIAAIDTAIRDGIDILSISIASSGPLYEDPVAIATFGATQGVFVSKAAGNAGLSFNSIGGGAPWVLTVGAGTVDREFGGTIVLGNGASIMGSSLYTLHRIPSPDLPIIYTNTCSEFQEALNITGKIVLCQADEVQEGDGYSLAESFRGSGVAGAIIVVNASELPSDEIGFPAIFISRGNGEFILNYVRGSNHPTATLVFVETVHGKKSTPRVADYSSGGPCPTSPFILKPDLIAPGDAIIASGQEKNPVNSLIGHRTNSFRVDSGTSMAAPHAAGVAALLKGIHPNWSPAAIRSAMMTTCDVLDMTHNPIRELGSNRAASPLAMGAGHVNPNRAMDPGLIYDVGAQDYINYLCGLNLTSRQIRTITRSSSFNCSNPSVDLNFPSFIAYFNCTSGTQSVQFQRTVTNVGKRMSSYIAELEKVEGFEFTVVPKTLVFKDENEKRSYWLKVQGPCLRHGAVIHGSVKWVEKGGGGHVVTSAIVMVNV